MKKLSHKSLLGQQGANLIEQIAATMGQVWRPTNVHDTGVDGTIEFRDPSTGEVSNRHIQVQSKATDSSWESETEAGFVYRVRKDDLDYWLRGNLPVVLVVSRPRTSEAYWVSIKNYFQEDRIRTTGKIEFRKDRDQFDKSALHKLIDLAIPAEKGIYKPPLRRDEELVSNLLAVRVFPKTLYIAETPFRRGGELHSWLVEHGIFGKREWILRNGSICSFYNLSEYPWIEIADQGTVKDFDTREWANAADEDRLREWTELLNTCLRAKLSREGIRFQHEAKFRFYYFLLPENKMPRFYRYYSQQKETRRKVVCLLTNKKTGDLLCYRHAAMKGRFYRFDGLWYLEINPTYFFTVNGKTPYMYYEDKLAGIKRLERNESVLGQLVMWERLLTDRGDIFHSEYPLLKFDGLCRFPVWQGIVDELWLPVEEEVATDEDDTELTGELF